MEVEHNEEVRQVGAASTSTAMVAQEVPTVTEAASVAATAVSTDLVAQVAPMEVVPGVAAQAVAAAMPEEASMVLAVSTAPMTAAQLEDAALLEAYEALMRDSTVKNAKKALLLEFKGSETTMMRALRRARSLRAERAAVAGPGLDS